MQIVLAIATSDLSMGSLIARYERDEMPTRYSTRAAYQSIVNLHIRPRWADTSVREVKTMGVEKWLNTLRLAPKSKCHVKGVMHLNLWVRSEMGSRND